jgi:crotonobetainyl-CoA:carnitine CoA-transferase CaiB-like acyl-CoA transferase
MLSNINILDVSRVLAGPFAAQTLADLGARVTKIEHPEFPDETRQWGPPFIDGTSSYFRCANRNKEFMELDLKESGDYAKFCAMLATTDVVIENFRSSSSKKLKLTYEDLKKLKPDIILCSISGYGRTSLWSERPGYDAGIQAQSGLMNITGPKDGEPSKCGVAIVDTVTALYAANAIQAAIIRRDRTGEGAHIDLSLLDCAVAAQVNLAQAYADTGIPAERQGNQHSQIVPYQLFKTKDSSIVVSAANDLQFRKLCEVLDRPRWVTDDRFATNDQRVIHRDLIVPLIQEVLLSKTSKEWSQCFVDQGIPNSVVQNYEDLARSEIGGDKGYFAEGFVRSPFQISGHRVQYSRSKT